MEECTEYNSQETNKPLPNKCCCMIWTKIQIKVTIAFFQKSIYANIWKNVNIGSLKQVNQTITTTQTVWQWYRAMAAGMTSPVSTEKATSVRRKVTNIYLGCILFDRKNKGVQRSYDLNDDMYVYGHLLLNISSDWVYQYRIRTQMSFVGFL